MRKSEIDRRSEHGGAAVKFLAILAVIMLVANAGFNYIPIAYEGASFRQEMDTAVVKGLAAGGQLKPLDVVKASINKAVHDYNIPADAVIQVKPAGAVIQAHVVYSKPVSMLPFGVWNYSYDFNYVAMPQGYLLKE